MRRSRRLQDIAREHDAQFIAPEQWHWGTDNGKAVVDYLRNQLKKTEFLLETAVASIAKQDDDTYRVICRHQRKRVDYTAKSRSRRSGTQRRLLVSGLATKS